MSTRVLAALTADLHRRLTGYIRGQVEILEIAWSVLKMVQERLRDAHDEADTLEPDRVAAALDRLPARLRDMGTLADVRRFYDLWADSYERRALQLHGERVLGRFGGDEGFFSFLLDLARDLEADLETAGVRAALGALDQVDDLLLGAYTQVGRAAALFSDAPLPILNPQGERKTDTSGETDKEDDTSILAALTADLHRRLTGYIRGRLEILEGEWPWRLSKQDKADSIRALRDAAYEAASQAAQAIWGTVDPATGQWKGGIAWKVLEAAQERLQDARDEADLGTAEVRAALGALDQVDDLLLDAYAQVERAAALFGDTPFRGAGTGPFSDILASVERLDMGRWVRRPSRIAVSEAVRAAWDTILNPQGHKPDTDGEKEA